MASYIWTGGSWCRQLWFFFLVAGVCLLQLRRHAAAGVAMALTVSMRMFPVVFVAGAVLALARGAWVDSERRTDLTRFLGAAMLTGLTMAGWSTLQFGLDAWVQFFDKMAHHGTDYFFWHIGYKKWAVYYPAVMQEAGWKWPLPAEVWDGLYHANWVWHALFRGTMSLVAAGLAWRREPAEGAMIFGAVLLWLWAMPANYYYVYLALLPVVFYRRGSMLSAVRVAMVFVALGSMSVANWFRTQPYEISGSWNQTMLVFFVLLVATFVIEELWRWHQQRKSH